ncbi:amidase [Allopusillimonas ginsengisoli]|uniref:amidase n=1 Tax=Allopusillimonas ginsengisoli TaxID=453575 RepID=UPI0010C220C5|nr:amidase [Allopusillimonas ginsengisoli]
MSEFLFWDAIDQRRAMLRGEISVRELISAHIAQIEVHDTKINAVVTRTFETALERADAADRKLLRGEADGALFGLPVAHKDTLPTAGVRTTFGSPIFSDSVPAIDHEIVTRQRRAGAISLGKTNVPEFAAGSHTYNPVFGATHNPYDIARSAGGSSGGAAAALASGFVSLADGTDMGGSLRNPASFCNVVGLRPTPGRVPNFPSAMPYNALSVVGPMGRSVRDVGLLLSAIAGELAHDPLSCGSDAVSFAYLRERQCKGLRVAVSRTLGGLPMDSAVCKGFNDGVAALVDMGCVVDEAEPDFNGADEVFETMRALSFATNYGPLRASDGDRMNESVRWNVDKGLALTGEQLSRAERERTRLLGAARSFWDTYEFLVAPVSQVLPFPVDQDYPRSIDGVSMENYISWMRSCSRITVLGLPAISLPCSFSDDGLPVGIQIIGRPRQEYALLCFALAFEAARPTGRRRPF